MAEHAARPSALTGLCRHCGEALSATAAGEFCCTGCAAAHRLIGELGLDRYYRQRCLDPGQRAPRPDSVPATIDATAYQQKRRDGLAEQGDGRYQTTAALPLRGEWLLTIVARRDSETWQSTQRIHLR